MMTRHSTRSLFTRLASAFCAVMLFLGLVASPSFAAARSVDSKPADTPTAEIMKAAEDIANPDKKPMSTAEIQARTNGGLNEIQGTADADKMINDSQPGKPDSAIAQKPDKQPKKSVN